MFPRHDVVAWMLTDAETRRLAAFSRHHAALRASHDRPSVLATTIGRARQAIQARIAPAPVVEPACCPA
jgi:hypothetical protein